MIQKSLEQAMMVYEGGGYNEEPDYTCNNHGSLSTWAVSFVEYFDTKEKIYETLGNKLSCDDINARNFVFEYFSNIVFDADLMKSESLRYGLKRSLKYFDKETYEQMDFICNFLDDKDMKEIFGKEVEIAKKHFEEMESKEFDSDDIPF